MVPSSRLLPRAGWIAAALALPWLLHGCDLAPLGTGATGAGGKGTTSSSSTTSSSGTTSSSTASSSGMGGGVSDGGDGGGEGGDAGDAAVTCDTTVVSYPLLASPHIPVCSPVSYSSNPPTSGPHYPIWAAYTTYTVPVPRGFYVHDLEHGGIVILHNCPAGCDAELAQLAAFLGTRPQDPLCTPPLKQRVVVTPDPLIPTRFAAAAWGWALTADCLDLTALGAFMDAHYAMGAEPTCADGWDVTAADAGIPSGCGTDPGDGGGGG